MWNATAMLELCFQSVPKSLDLALKAISLRTVRGKRCLVCILCPRCLHDLIRTVANDFLELLIVPSMLTKGSDNCLGLEVLHWHKRLPSSTNVPTSKIITKLSNRYLIILVVESV